MDNIVISQVDKSLSTELTDYLVHANSIVSFVDYLIQNAIAKQISDIHIEPHEKHCRIRFRRDGLLYEAGTIPLHTAEQMITRLKIMALMNIAEKRLPQDGRIKLASVEKIDIRINTCPTLFGEKMVLRILDRIKMNLDMDGLGLTIAQKQLFIEKLSNPQGLILVTGPTGSGKTSTLYSALHYLNQVEKNIITVEDPVEIELPGINQVNINTKIGLNFAATLRAFLRQDPDIIMIGEIRDQETAHIAVQAAQTGHLVLSTLHTNHALETILRLQSMDINAYQLMSALSLMIAQRLVRKLCRECKYEPINSLHSPCCHQGYKGRTAIFELVPMTAKLSQKILHSENLQTPLDSLDTEEYLSLWEAGWRKVQAGITNHAELIRVVGCNN